MSIRKRTWKTAIGAEKTAWIVDYSDGTGTRRQKTFAKKKDADTFEATAKIEIRDGIHVADSASVSVSQAGRFWIASAEAAGLERATIVNYRQHLDLHITPFLGATRLSTLTIPNIRAFEDQLRLAGRSPTMQRKVLVSLGSLIADAQERGLVARNVVRDMRSRRKGKQERQEKRQKGRLKVGVDIPTREEVKAIVDALQGRWRPLLLTAIFTGLRASELRGLRWGDIDLDRGEIRVHQRADRFNDIGRPKSEAGDRTVPIPPLVANTLREWKLSSPKGTLDLAFANGKGNVETYSNIVKRGFFPAQLKAGVALASPDGVHEAKYTGLHCLRHFYASWCINRTQDGGLGLPPKVVQERMGHSSIILTMDTYGHIFPRGDDAAEMAAAERSLFA
jgi:integrase